MASGDVGVDMEAQRPMDLSFVDHVELKIVSPQKEVISPNKAYTRNKNDAPIDNTEKVVAEISTKLDNLEGLDVEIIEAVSKMSDIKESVNANSEETIDRFIDRQESHTALAEPEVLSSPNKTVDALFNFLNTPSSQSLDALNNNSETVENERSDNDNSEELNDVTSDIYLGKEVDLHKKEVVEKEKETGDAAMNLYWYTSSLDVDLDIAELEALKESSLSDNFRSDVHVNIANGYYSSKTKDVDLDAINQNVYKSELKFETKGQEDKEKWSPAFESASSRLLDLASELKAEPKDKKNIENKMIKDEESGLERHPWGLDESRINTKLDDKVQDELPDIAEVSDSQTEQKVIEMLTEIAKQGRQTENYDLTVSSSSESKIASKKQQSEDEADAIGYMELADRPIRETVTKPVSAPKQDDEVNITKELRSHPGKFVVKSEDVADAIGYMELADRPIRETVTITVSAEAPQPEVPASNARNIKTNVDVADAIGYMELADRELIKENENKIQEAEYIKESKTVWKGSDISAEDQQHINVSEDVADAVGYMKIGDRPVEQIMVQSDNAILESIQQDIAQNNLKEIATEIVKNTDVEDQILTASDNVNMSANVPGTDMPDASTKHDEIPGEEMVLENDKVDSLEVRPALETQFYSVPFESFTIRRKYLVGDNSEEALQKLGGMFLETETLIDEYLDDENYTLTLNDCWLRLRNKKFEMKLNAGFGVGPNRSPSVQMLVSENDIKDVLTRMYLEDLQNRKISERQLDALVDELNIMEFVTFETKRNRYQLGNFIITMDKTNFSYHVAEVEVVASTAEDMLRFLSHLDTVSHKLGFLPLQSLSC